MTSYTYIARDATGLRKEGLLQAETSHDAVEELHQRGLTPTSIDKAQQGVGTETSIDSAQSRDLIGAGGVLLAVEHDVRRGDCYHHCPGDCG